MAFLVLQTTAFFEDADQMAMPVVTRARLQQEGIVAVNDLINFDKDALNQVADNLRCPGGRAPNTDPNVPAGATMPTPPFVFGAKSQKRLLAACEMVRYHDTVDGQLSVGMIRWDPVIRNFNEQWSALLERKKIDDMEVPKILKTLTVIKWTESFGDFLHRKIGVRSIPLACVTRADEAVPATPLALAAHCPHSTEHGSVEGKLIARSSHDHPKHKDDNAQVCYFLEEATRSTSYAATIKPFQHRKNG